MNYYDEISEGYNELHFKEQIIKIKDILLYLKKCKWYFDLREDFKKNIFEDIRVSSKKKIREQIKKKIIQLNPTCFDIGAGSGISGILGLYIWNDFFKVFNLEKIHFENIFLNGDNLFLSLQNNFDCTFLNEYVLGLNLEKEKTELILEILNDKRMKTLFINLAINNIVSIDPSNELLNQNPFFTYCQSAEGFDKNQIKKLKGKIITELKLRLRQKNRFCISLTAIQNFEDYELSFENLRKLRCKFYILTVLRKSNSEKISKIEEVLKNLKHYDFLKLENLTEKDIVYLLTKNEEKEEIVIKKTDENEEIIIQEIDE